MVHYYHLRGDSKTYTDKTIHIEFICFFPMKKFVCMYTFSHKKMRSQNCFEGIEKIFPTMPSIWLLVSTLKVHIKKQKYVIFTYLFILFMTTDGPCRLCEDRLLRRHTTS